jgi:transcriptional regulator with XRE-family HTH domain
MKTRSFSEALRQAIRASGRTQRDLAKAASVTQGGISRFLCGQSIELRTADKLAAALGITFNVPKPAKNGRKG